MMGEVDEHGSTPHHIACRRGDWDAICALAERLCPFPLSRQDVDGNTPLHLAVSVTTQGSSSGKDDAIRALVKACPTAATVKNKEGLLPLHMACRHAPNNAAVIALLVDAYPPALEVRTKVSSSE